MSWFLLALTLSASAADGHYHPLDVAGASARFAVAQEVAGTSFQAREDEAKAVAAALRDFEEALDLLGERAPADQRARQAALEKQFHREVALLRAVASNRLDAFDAAFGDALTRAIGSRDLQTCRGGGSSGPRTTPRFGAPSARQDCEGPSLNAALAAAMDADPQLEADLAEVLTDDWPPLTIDTTPVAAVGAGSAAISVIDWMRRGARDALIAIELADDDARLGFQVAIEQGATKEQQQQMVAAAREVTATTAARRAALAAGVIDATEAANAKQVKKGGTRLAWCAQPALLGGCTVPTLAPAALDSLAADKKVDRAFDRANATRPPSD